MLLDAAILFVLHNQCKYKRLFINLSEVLWKLGYVVDFYISVVEFWRQKHGAGRIPIRIISCERRSANSCKAAKWTKLHLFGPNILACFSA